MSPSERVRLLSIIMPEPRLLLAIAIGAAMGAHGDRQYPLACAILRYINAAESISRHSCSKCGRKCECADAGGRD